VAQLRDDIDSGRTGDKVAAIDHAAAPLGTDEEVAGTPVPPDLIARTRGIERKSIGDATAASQKTVAGRLMLAVVLLLGLIAIALFTTSKT
jgi:hypothetical protein